MCTNLEKAYVEMEHLVLCQTLTHAYKPKTDRAEIINQHSKQMKEENDEGNDTCFS